MNKKTLWDGVSYLAPEIRNLFVTCEQGFADSFNTGGIKEEDGEWE